MIDRGHPRVSSPTSPLATTIPRDSSGKTTLPLYTPQLRLTAFVLDGMGAGLSDSGLAGDRLELTAALRVALEVPGAVDRFLGGETSFAPARLE